MSLRYFPILVFNIVDTEANKPYLEKKITSNIKTIFSKDLWVIDSGIGESGSHNSNFNNGRVVIENTEQKHHSNSLNCRTEKKKDGNARNRQNWRRFTRIALEYILKNVGPTFFKNTSICFKVSCLMLWSHACLLRGLHSASERLSLCKLRHNKTLFKHC